jgi:upstream activation factor subunit UAF30
MSGAESRTIFRPPSLLCTALCEVVPMDTRLPTRSVTLPITTELATLAIMKESEMAKTTLKAKNSAFMKPMQPSEHLAKIVVAEPLPRTEVTKKIWAHIKKHKLQNPKNKREILADDKLQPIFGSKKLDMFQMTKAVNKHLK